MLLMTGSTWKGFSVVVSLLELKTQGVSNQAGDRRLEAIGLRNKGIPSVLVSQKNTCVEDSGLRSPVSSLASDFQRVGTLQI